jgi:hypothetical protein
MNSMSVIETKLGVFCIFTFLYWGVVVDDWNLDSCYQLTWNANGLKYALFLTLHAKVARFKGHW